MKNEEEVVRVKCPFCGEIFQTPSEGLLFYTLSKSNPRAKKGTTLCMKCYKVFQISGNIFEE